MTISYHAEGVRRPKLRYRIISAWLKKVMEKFEFTPGDLGYIFCDDEYLKNINIKYLSHDFYTDIVTFDYSSGKIISGDMFISMDRVNENAVIFQCNATDELLRVIVHGLLHLLGYTDSTELEKETMRSLEDECVIMFKEIENGCIK